MDFGNEYIKPVYWIELSLRCAAFADALAEYLSLEGACRRFLFSLLEPAVAAAGQTKLLSSNIQGNMGSKVKNVFLTENRPCSPGSMFSEKTGEHSTIYAIQLLGNNWCVCRPVPV